MRVPSRTTKPTARATTPSPTRRAPTTTGANAKSEVAAPTRRGRHGVDDEVARAGDGGAPKVSLHSTSLSGKARASFVRDAFLALHQHAKTAHPDGYRAKLERLSESPFAFFRGTAALFFRDLEGADKTAPHVVINGDVHPENFGVTRAKSGALAFGLNDFDEGTRAPFTFDLRRGATGFELLARARGLKEKDRESIVRAFVDGYSDRLEESGARAQAKPAFVEGSAPKILDELFVQARAKTPADFLKKATDPESGRFVVGDRVRGVSGALRAKLVKAAVGARDHEGTRLFSSSLTVVDVAERLGSGTASLAARRYWVLVRDDADDARTTRLLEVKEARASAVTTALGVSPLALRIADGRRVAGAHDLHLGASGVPHGHTTVEGTSFLVRERIAQEKTFDAWSASADDLVDYARACGAAVAHAHARAGDASGVAASRIRATFSEKDLKDEMVAFASSTAHRVESDWAHFVRAVDEGELE